MNGQNISKKDGVVVRVAMAAMTGIGESGCISASGMSSWAVESRRVCSWPCVCWVSVVGSVDSSRRSGSLKHVPSYHRGSVSVMRGVSRMTS